jgi:hypothetical protein
MNHRLLLALSILAVVPPGADAADSWKFRPGLWEMTSTQTFKFAPIPPTLPPDQQAQMRARQDQLKPPPVATMQFCVDEKGQPVKSMFDPANQPPDTCSERVLSQTDEAREIEDDCNLPLPQLKDVAPRSLPARARRHILLTGDGAGTIDRSEIAVQPPNASVTQISQWVAAECGAVKAAPQTKP